MPDRRKAGFVQSRGGVADEQVEPGVGEAAAVECPEERGRPVFVRRRGAQADFGQDGVFQRRAQAAQAFQQRRLVPSGAPGGEACVEHIRQLFQHRVAQGKVIRCQVAIRVEAGSFRRRRFGVQEAFQREAEALRRLTLRGIAKGGPCRIEAIAHHSERFELREAQGAGDAMVFVDARPAFEPPFGDRPMQHLAQVGQQVASEATQGRGGGDCLGAGNGAQARGRSRGGSGGQPKTKAGQDRAGHASFASRDGCVSVSSIARVRKRCGMVSPAAMIRPTVERERSVTPDDPVWAWTGNGVLVPLAGVCWRRWADAVVGRPLPPPWSASRPKPTRGGGECQGSVRFARASTASNNT